MSLRLPPESRCLQVLSLALASTLFLSACSSDKEHESSILTPGASTTAADQGEDDAAAGSGAEQEQQADTLGQVCQAYAAVLDNPSSIAFNYDPAPMTVLLGSYSYAIVEATGDDRPDLLLEQAYREVSPVVLITTEADDPSKIVVSQEVLVTGAAGAGGGRFRILGSPSGNEILQASWHSIQPDKQLESFTLSGNHFVPGAKQSFSMDGIGEFPGTTELNWLDSTDRSGLDSISSSSAAAPAAPSQESKRSGGGPRPTLDSQPQAAANTPSGNTGGSGGSSVVVDGATTRMTGIVRKKTGRQVLDGQPEGGFPYDINNEFWILEFTPRQEVVARTSGGQGTRTKQTYGASLASSTSNQNRVSELAGLEGKTATVTVSSNDMYWQSDASLPMGTVRIGGDYQIAAS